MDFNPKKTYFGKLSKWDSLLKFISGFSSLFLVAATIGLLLNLVYENKKFVGFFIFFFLIFLFLESLERFRVQKLIKKSEKERTDNLADFLSLDLLKIFLSRKPKNPNSLFYYLLEDCPRLIFVFHRSLLSPSKVKRSLKEEGIEEEKKDEIVSLIRLAKIVAEKKGKEIIEPEDLLMVAFKESPLLKKIMVLTNIFEKDIENLISWLESLKKEKPDIFAIRGSMGRKWSAGYSITLDRYGINITEKIKEYGELISHNEEVNFLERALIKSGKSNALIVGNPGSGRKSVVYNFAQRSLFGKSLESLNYKRVIEINMESLLARIQSVEEVEFTLDNIFKEAVLAGDIILVINNIHEFAGESSKIGTINITGIISPFLSMPDFKFIAITDYSGLHTKIEKNHSFLNFFEKIEISEVSKNDTLKILQTLVAYYEKKYKVFIPYSTLKQIVDLSEKYLPNSFFPEKGIDLLEESVIFVSSSKKEKVVLLKHVNQVVSNKTDIPVGDVEEKEKEILLNLENLIHKRIINQEEAVKEISTALRRSRAEIKTRKGPMGSFLFLGSTGVGKTETAKALADIYFGSEEKIIRLDMSEFQNTSDISRLIGGEKEVGMLTSPVRESPFSLLLLDEIEKAHPNILNLFLQILDEGHITDGTDRKIDFKNTIIIATSNAGYQIILDAIDNKDPFEKVKENLFNFIFKNNIFKPEFINRFDSAVMFHPLTQDNLLKISALIFGSLKINLEKKGIKLIISDNLREKIVELSYEPKFGAREMRRIIQEKVENNLAEALLQGKIQRGDRVGIDDETFEVIKR